MKVYLVNGFDQYYPSGDNTLAVFWTREAAQEHVAKLVSYDTPRWDRCDYYEIYEKEVTE